MKKLIIALFLINSLFAQVEFDLSGYVVNLPTYQKPQKTLADIFGLDQNTFLDLTRIRLRSEIYILSNTRLNIDYEISALYFNSLTTLSLGNASNNRQAAPLKWNLINEKNFTVDHYFDRLYLKQRFNFGEVVVGRQRIAWGSGRVWNPTDLFNPINPANFFKIEKDGADAVSSKIFLGNFTDLNLVVNFTKKINQTNFGARFRTNYNEFDLALIGGYFDKRYKIGFDFAGNLFDAGVRGESITSINENNYHDNFTKYILGVDYQFSSKLYGLIEYHYNGEGKKSKSEYQFLRLINGEILNLSKNYLNITAGYLIHPLVNLSLSSTQNLNDGSGFSGFTIQYSYLQNLDISFGSQFSYGDNFTEYWFYGTSIYLLGQFYF
jgi:hypothetical protein